MPTTAPKEKHFAFAVDHLVVEVISIVRRKSNAVGVRRRSFVPRVSVGDYSFTGRSQWDRNNACVGQYAGLQTLTTSAL